MAVSRDGGRRLRYRLPEFGIVAEEDARPAAYQAQFMAKVEIARVEAAPRGGVGIHPGIPLAALHQHRRVGDQRVAADMIEMKMRVDDEVDLAGITVDRLQPRAHLFAGPKADAEQPGEP